MTILLFKIDSLLSYAMQVKRITLYIFATAKRKYDASELAIQYRYCINKRTVDIYEYMHS